MSRVARTVRVAAPVSTVWATLVELESWPAWASQFKGIERVDAGPLGSGSRVRVRPKGMPSSIWQVTAYEEGRMLTWASSLGPGLRVVGGHELSPHGDATDAMFWLEAQGPLGQLVAPVLDRTLFSRKTRSATEGLRRHLEGHA
jgi:uncharacterized membrane protein